MNIKNALILILILISYGYCQEEKLIKYPAMKDMYLSNGLRVILIEYHEEKTVSYRMLVKVGKADEPKGKEGIASFTANVLQEGTTTKKGDQIEDEIAAIGSSLSISEQPSYVIFGMDVIGEFGQKGLELFSDVMLNPTFPDEGMKRVKNEMINNINLEKADNDAIAFNYGRALLFGCGNPLGRTNTESSIRSISAKDSRGFYQKYYGPANSILLVIGDFSNEQMLEQLNEKLGKWKGTKQAQHRETKSDYEKASRLMVVNKPRMTQAVIYLNQWGIVSGSPDYYEYEVANYILGGGNFSSRLMSAVRAKGGKTYHISSRADIHSDYGVFNIFTFTRNEELDNMLKMIKTEIEKLNNDGISEDELKKAKEYISGAVPLHLESPTQIANKILDGIMQGFTVEDLSKEVINYNKVTVEGVNKTIRKYIKHEKLNTVIVCDAKDVKQQLSKIGKYEKANANKAPCH